jgi:hypothetical protein
MLAFTTRGVGVVLAGARFLDGIYVMILAVKLPVFILALACLGILAVSLGIGDKFPIGQKHGGTEHTLRLGLVAFYPCGKLGGKGGFYGVFPSLVVLDQANGHTIILELAPSSGGAVIFKRVGCDGDSHLIPPMS